ncbi:hypothetical protein N7463_006198 [Penicillium fimorum]|uniref:Uncharacterized protein n=1 Tax=Penicillium fimorum TaxID=1882269 RepID=A0A9W9XUB9_9EURO|nr:hypothetical protein N7463_006198 [Penicillium fimorum]
MAHTSGGSTVPASQQALAWDSRYWLHIYAELAANAYNDGEESLRPEHQRPDVQCGLGVIGRDN